VGYVKVRHDRIAMDPDERVREALGLVFRKFAEFQSMRQVHLWLRQERVLLPCVETTEDGRRSVWKLPVYNTVRALLTNPVYGGAYAFGRTASRVTVENGRKRISRGHRRDREEWDVLIVDHHDGYIPWAEYERNQRLIADNANCRGLMVRGAVRRGDALLAGLLRCSHCGRRVHVSYSGTDGYCVRYNCRGAHLNHGTRPCIAFGGLRVDAAVSKEVLRHLALLGVEAALEAIATREEENAGTRRQAELALTQARYEADLARRQYDVVDPANRLVAAELERRWNDRLAEVQRQEEWLATMTDHRSDTLNSGKKDRLMALGADLETAWSHPGATAETRKRILRAVLEEIVVTLTEAQIELVLHWRGGDHTRLAVPRNKTGQHRWSSNADVRDLIHALARQQRDGGIAATLNRLGKRTGRGNPWTEARVRSFRSQHRVPVHRPGEMAERGELTLEEAARQLDVSKMTVLRLISAGTITGTQVCKGAPWAIPETQITGLDGASPRAGRPRTYDQNQKVMDFQ
jgi:excisionase family DNA binding protein